MKSESEATDGACGGLKYEKHPILIGANTVFVTLLLVDKNRLEIR